MATRTAISEAIQTRQASPLETTAFDELGGSFRGELLLPTSPGYTTTGTSNPADAQGRTKGGRL